jgi:hypothetical protein
MTGPSTSDEAQVLAAHRDINRGMLERDTSLLSHLLAGNYTLAHMTDSGRRSRNGCSQVDSGEMQYHSAETSA